MSRLFGLYDYYLNRKLNRLNSPASIAVNMLDRTACWTLGFR